MSASTVAASQRSLVAVPLVRVEVDGVPLAAEHALAAVQVDQALSTPARVELELALGAGPVEGLDRLHPGAELTIRVASQPGPTADSRAPQILAEADVTAVEHAYDAAGDHVVRVRGYDRLDRLRREQKTAVHLEADVAALARSAAAEAGLEVVCDAPTPTISRLLQCQRTDLDLLRHEAEQVGLYLTVRERTLHLITLAGDSGGGLGEPGSTAAPLELALGAELLEVTVEEALPTASVTVVGWDPAAAEAVAGEAHEPRSPARADDRDRAAARWLSGRASRGDDHASAQAAAELDRRVAHERVVRGSAEGSPGIRPGARIALRGIEPPAAGTFVVTGATHRLDAVDGYVTTFTTRPPDPPHEARSRAQRRDELMLTLGIVEDVDDPAGLGRVRVALPALADLATGWLPVVCPGAGPAKGIVALPDMGDRVAVLTPVHDPALALVLGGLFGQDVPPEPGVVGGRVRRSSLVTAGGIRVVLADDQETLHLEDAAGSYLDLGPQGVTLHAAVPLDIAAPGQPVTIRGARIDFEEA